MFESKCSWLSCPTLVGFDLALLCRTQRVSGTKCIPGELIPTWRTPASAIPTLKPLLSGLPSLKCKHMCKRSAAGQMSSVKALVSRPYLCPFLPLPLHLSFPQPSPHPYPSPAPTLALLRPPTFTSFLSWCLPCEGESEVQAHVQKAKYVVVCFCTRDLLELKL